MNVKICGVTSLDVAKKVEQAGADFIGFVFAPSKRQISPENAAAIAKDLSPAIKKVGVFVNESVATMNDIAATVGLDYIQLHGDEPVSTAEQLDYPIIKAYSIERVKPSVVASYPCDYLLIDSPGEAYRGGSGKTFTWEKLDTLDIPRNKLILAGGLSTENITEAIKQVCPFGVDVSSGVETNNHKDVEKISLFIQQAKQAERLI